MSQYTLRAASPGALRRLFFSSLLLCFFSTGTSFAQPCLKPVFDSPPTSITAYTTPNSCTPLISFLARVLDSVGVTFSFTTSGATLASGAGTGSGLAFNRGVTHLVITAKRSCDSAKHFLDIHVLDSIKPHLTATNITAYAGPQCGANVPYSVGVTDNCPPCSHDLLIALGFKLLGVFNGHSYYTTPLKSNFDAVNNFASSIAGAHLVSISSAAENAFIAAALPDTQLAWIGFTDRDVEGVWKWTDGSPVTYTNWCFGQPDDFLGNQDWAVLNSIVPFQTGECWDDGHSPVFPGTGQPNNFVGIVELDVCGTLLERISGLDSNGFFPVGVSTVKYKATDASGNVDSIAFTVTVLDTTKPKITPIADITVNAAPGQCGAIVPYSISMTDNCPGCPSDLLLALGFKLLGTFNGHSYYTTPLKSNFDAVNAVALSVVGAHLVSISSAAENAFIAAALPDTQLAWIGFTDRVVEGVFQWTDGSPVTYTNWCTGQPDDFMGGQDWAVLNSVVPGQTGDCWDDGHSPVFPGNGQPNNFVGIVESDCIRGLVRIAGLDSGGFFPIGTTVVTYVAVDASGNVDTFSFKVNVLGGAAGACSITVTPSNNTYTGGVPTNIYLGYGPQSATLNAGGCPSGAATYLWTGPTSMLSCTTCQSPVFTPTAAGIYTFTVTKTCGGCTTTCTVRFCVKDIIDYTSNPNNRKVYLCHVPPGNPSNAHTLSISINAVPAHIGNHTGDALGKCDNLCATTARFIAGNNSVVNSEIRIYPNPASNTFFVELPYFERSASVTLMDIQGRVLQTRTLSETDDHKLRFDLGSNPRGLYMVDVIYDDHRYRAKVIME